MRAAVYRGVNDVRPERIPVPSIGPGEALMRVAACGVCGTDLKKVAHGLVPPPRVFGHEMAGTLVRVGPDVQGWKAGDRVVAHHHVPCGACFYCARRLYAHCPLYKRTATTAGFEPAGGGFAEYVRIMDWAVARGLVRIPEHISFEEAAFLEPLNTCLKAVRRLGTAEGDTVLVLGQGQIGLLFTMLLVRFGVRVVACDRMPSRLRRAEERGAETLLAGAEQSLAQALRDRTEGRGADGAIVAAPDSRAVTDAMQAVRPGGRVLLFAHTRLQDPVEVDAGAVCMLEKDLIGSYSADVESQEECARILFRREIDVRGLITHRFSLEQIQEAIRLASSPTDDSLKVMVIP